MPPVDLNYGLLFIAGLIAAIPSISIAVLGFTLRRSNELSRAVVSCEAHGKTIDALERQLREERDKRDELEKVVYRLPGEIARDYLHREDHVRTCGQTDKKLDALNARVEALSASRPTPLPRGTRD